MRELNKPDSVIPFGTDVYPSGPKLTLWLKLPTRKRCGHTIASLFGIAPDKAFLATTVTSGTGGLLHHHFTLTQHQNQALHPVSEDKYSSMILALRGLFLWSWLCIAAASR